MNDTYITFIGNIGTEPELRTTGTGLQVVSFNVLSTPRTFDRQTNEFKDGELISVRCTAWRQLAENINASFHKGNRVVVYGRLVQSNYEKDGVKQYRQEITIDDIGASVRYATVAIERQQSQNPAYSNSFNAAPPAQSPAQAQSQTQFSGSPAANADDPFAVHAAPAQATPDAFGSAPDAVNDINDENPFG